MNVINVRHTREYDVYIGRGKSPVPNAEPLRYGLFGNPFSISEQVSRNEAIKRYRMFLEQQRAKNTALWQEIQKLKGKTLGCWCKPAACHGDIIKEFLENTS